MSTTIAPQSNVYQTQQQQQQQTQRQQGKSQQNPNSQTNRTNAPSLSVKASGQIKKEEKASASEIATSTSQTVGGANKAVEFGSTVTTFSKEARQLLNGGGNGSGKTGLLTALKRTYSSTEGGSDNKTLGAVEKALTPLSLVNNFKGAKQSISDLKNGKIKEGVQGLLAGGGGALTDGLGLAETGAKGAEKGGNFVSKLANNSSARHSSAARTAARAATEARKGLKAAEAAGDTGQAAAKAAELSKHRESLASALKMGSKTKDAATKAGSFATKAGKFASKAGKFGGPAGGALTIAEGGFQVFDGIKEGDKAKAGRGAAKSVAGGLMVAGAATGNPVLAAAGGLTYAGVTIYENREAIGNAAKTGAKFVGNAAKKTVETQVKTAKAVGGAVVDGAEKAADVADAVKDKGVETAKTTVKSAGKAAKKVLGWFS